MTLEDDLSPSLGGARAAPEPPPEPAAAPGGQGGPELGGPLEALFAGLLAGFGGPGEAPGGSLGDWGRQFATLMEETLLSVEAQFPPALAAFEGLVSAFERVIEDALEPSVDPAAPNAASDPGPPEAS